MYPGGNAHEHASSALVSVVIPAYERPAQLGDALRSLDNQSVRPHEVIVCDDGSTQDLREVLRQFESTLRIQFTRIPPSGSPALPRNIAAASATGDWIAFLDSDDEWAARKLESMHSFMRPDADVIYHPLASRRSGHRTLMDRLNVVGSRLTQTPLWHLACIGNAIALSGSMIRTQVFRSVGGFSTVQPLAEDFDLWIRVALHGGRFLFVDEILGCYRISSDAFSAASARNLAAIAAVYERNIPALPAEWRPHSRAAMHLALSRELLAMRDGRGARRHLAHATPLANTKLRAKRAAGWVYSWLIHMT